MQHSTSARAKGPAAFASDGAMPVSELLRPTAPVVFEEDQLAPMTRARGGVQQLRSPRHIGFIPDGNRRWATAHRMPKENGYAHGLNPGLRLFDTCREMQIEEVSVYGYTRENTHRPAAQTVKFREACVEFALEVERRGAALLVVGDDSSRHFPPELLRFRTRQGKGLKVNLLVNYSWQWDLDGLRSGALRTTDISRVDLIVRWGGARRLSGFLPVQSAYADFYVVDDYWPDFKLVQFLTALQWFSRQDRTLGG